MSDAVEMAVPTEADAPALPPPGDYAIVEILGHRTLIGRVTEVERFGTKLLSIEPLFGDRLLAAVLIGGGSIYQFTPCSPEIAAKRQPKNAWQLPPSVAAVLPPELLPAPESPSPLDDEDGVPF
jgi:hypothetical protein